MDTHLSRFRLIQSAPASGAWNMALDEALLISAAKKNALPALRLYAWQPACLSLGYAQPVEEIDLDRLHNRGWEIVRRPTGGRAILHTDELTYSLTAPVDLPLVQGGVLESYRRISSGLTAALQLLGAQVNADKEYSTSEPADKQKPVCFEVPSNYEITAGGKKLIGSAQARKYNGVLQHGSLPLTGSITRIADVLTFSTEAELEQTKNRIQAHATTLEEVLGKIVPWTDAAQALINGFKSALQISFIKTEPTPDELSLAQQLCSEKYNSPSWNQKH